MITKIDKGESSNSLEVHELRKIKKWKGQIHCVFNKELLHKICSESPERGSSGQKLDIEQAEHDEHLQNVLEDETDHS